MLQNIEWNSDPMWHEAFTEMDTCNGLNCDLDHIPACKNGLHIQTMYSPLRLSVKDELEKKWV